MSNISNPKYVAAMVANAKLMADNDEKPRKDTYNFIADSIRNERYINALLMFGPAHGMVAEIQNRDTLLWEETEPPIWLPVDYSKPIRRRTHTYRREDEYESSNMEECTIFVHDEKCCDARMPGDKRT